MTEERWNIVEPTPPSRSILCFWAGMIAGAGILLGLARWVLGAGWYPYPSVCTLIMAYCVFTTSLRKIKVRDVWDAPRVAGFIRYGFTALFLITASVIAGEELMRLSGAIR